MYELNAMNIDAQGTQQNQRSTFTDLYNGPGSRPYDPVTNRFNLNYVQNLGVNWLWFQPIHPIGIQNRQTDPNTGQPYAVGSPYSVKNFFQINPLLGKADTRDEAMQEFTNFVAAADAAGINVMLDEPFNHSAWDCELEASGVYYFATNAQPTDLIANSEARFYSRTNEYDQRASSAANVAQAPDRYDFGKWSDVADIYFGRYAALVPNASQSGNYTSEADWFDYTIGDENSTGTGNGHFDQSRKTSGAISPTAFSTGWTRPAARRTRRRTRPTRALTVCAPISARACRRNAGNTSSTRSAAGNGILSS